MKRTHLLALSALSLFGIVACSPTSNTSNQTSASSTPISSPVSSSSSSSISVEKKVKATTCTNFTPEFVSLPADIEKKEFVAGKETTIELVAGEILTSGFNEIHAEHIFVTVGEKTLHPTFANDKMSVTFIAPEADFVLETIYSAQQHIVQDGAHISLSSENRNIRLLGVIANETYDYFDCYLLVPQNYLIQKVYAKIGDEPEVDLSSTIGCSFNRTTQNLYSVTIRPDYENVKGDVVLRIEGEQHNSYAINYVGIDADKIDETQTILPKTAVDSDYVTATLVLKDNYYLADVTLSVSLEDYNEYSYGNEITLYFSMPKSDLTLTFDIKEKKSVSTTTGEHITEALVYNADDVFYGVQIDVAAPEQIVYVFAKAENGYKPHEAKIGDESFEFTYYSPEQYMARVTLPKTEGPYVISTTAIAVYQVSEADKQTVQFSEGNLYAENETVEFIVAVPTGKTIDTITVVDENGVDLGIEVTINGVYGSFLMPKKNCKVKVTFKDVSTEKATVKGVFDEDLFNISSSTNYDWDFATGFETSIGTTINFTVEEYEGTAYYVGIKNGAAEEIIAVKGDEYGDFSYNRTIIVNGNVEIVVSYNQSDIVFTPTVAKATVKADFDSDEYRVNSSTNYDWDFAKGFEVDVGTSFYLNVVDDYGLEFYVGIKNGTKEEILAATEDEETGEYTFGKSITVEGDVLIVVRETQSSISFK